MNSPHPPTGRYDASVSDSLSDTYVNVEGEEDLATRQRPTPQALAGIYVCAEGEEDLTVRARSIPGLVPHPMPQDGKRPAPEDLAGIYVCAEGEEDLTIRKARVKPDPSPIEGSSP